MKRVCIVRQKTFRMQRNLRRSASTLIKEGYEVDVICVGEKGEKKQEKLEGVNINRVYFSYHRGRVFWYLFDYAAFFILASLKLAWLSLKKRYDVVEVHTMPDFLVFATLLPKLLGSKVILYMFENTTEVFVASFGISHKHVLAKIFNWIAKISAGYADSVIVSDGPLHKESVENCGISGDKITIVLNVPDDSVFNHEPASFTEENNHFQMIVVSTIVKRYGIQTLIKAVPLLLENIPELKVDIVGDGELRPDLERMTRNLGVEKYVNFTGFLPYETVPDYIARAHVAIAPMIDDVGAPNKIFEYIAVGKATVASSLPGVRAVFKDSSVLYFKPGDEKDLADRILELYRNPEKREAFVISAKAQYNELRWPIMKDRYMGVYKRLLG